ncbi:hypothetical protein BGX28_001502 [Mortierella sp. GBA30]|nr:hypothetical protein BGX28_001502 [Mortierella sp. GBA30]
MGSFSDEDSDSGFYDAAAVAAASASYEQDMDEDREWGLFDEDDALPEVKLKTLSTDSMAPFLYHTTSMGYGGNMGSTGNNYRHRSPSQRSYSSLAPVRDRRSSTGSLVQFTYSSPCEMGTFVASRRGSASSINSAQSQAHSQNQNVATASANSSQGPLTCFPEGDLTPQQILQPMTSIPFINKRSSSQAYRYHQQQRLQQHQGIVFSNPSPTVQGIHVCNNIAEEPSVHPLQGTANPLSPSVESLPINTPFIEIKDAAIAAQLTCVEFGLFKKLKILRDMGNFNTTMAIIGAMNTSSIHRLVHTRELLQGKEIWNTFNELEHLMASERSFFEYRSALKAQKLPCIPYLGVHLGDLLSISEGNRDFRQDGTIHWQKFCLLTEVISTVMHFQSEPYRIQPDPYISRVITDTHVLDDEDLYTKSIGAEPGKLQHSRSLSKFSFF